MSNEKVMNNGETNVETNQKVGLTIKDFGPRKIGKRISDRHTKILLEKGFTEDQIETAKAVNKIKVKATLKGIAVGAGAATAIIIGTALAASRNTDEEDTEDDNIIDSTCTDVEDSEEE